MEGLIETPGLKLMLAAGDHVGQCTWPDCTGEVRLMQGSGGVCLHCGAQYKVALIAHLTRVEGA